MREDDQRSARSWSRTCRRSTLPMRERGRSSTAVMRRGNLVGREPGAAEVAQRVHVESSAVAEHDGGGDLFPAMRSRKTHDCGRHDIGVRDEGVFHLARRHVEAAGDDELLQAVDDAHEPVRGDLGDVARSEPAVGSRASAVSPGRPQYPWKTCGPRMRSRRVLRRARRPSGQRGRRRGSPCSERARRRCPTTGGTHRVAERDR